MNVNKRTYTPAEKAKIALEAIKGELSMVQISSQYGVHVTQIKAWKAQALEALQNGFDKKPDKLKEQNAILVDKLYSQIGQLTIECEWLKKNLSSLNFEQRKTMIDKKERLSLRRQCVLLNIAKSTIYYKQRPTITEVELAIINKIDEIYTAHPYFGTRRMSRELIDYGIYVGRDFIRKAYNILGIGAIYPKINLSKRNHQHKIYPYLLRNLLINYVNQVWSIDITYIRLKHGFAYLVAIIDWFSRKVLSWRISNTMEVGFCVEALNEALENYPVPEIFNTDQGPQFTAIEFTSILLNNNIRISMDGRGRALDNVFIERFWRSLKQEKIYLLELSSVLDAKVAISEYMDFYNRKRKHQSLDYITPDEMYYKNLELKAS